MPNFSQLINTLGYKMIKISFEEKNLDAYHSP